MKKTIIISTIATTVVLAGPFFSNEREVLSEHPLQAKDRSIDHGGTKTMIDAYRDGVGVSVGTFEADKSINNAPINTLVYKYGELAKENSVSLKDQVLFGGNSSAEEIELANKIISSESSGGAPEEPTAPEGMTIEGQAGNRLFYTTCTLVEHGTTLEQFREECASTGMRVPEPEEIYSTRTYSYNGITYTGDPENGIPVCSDFGNYMHTNVRLNSTYTLFLGNISTPNFAPGTELADRYSRCVSGS
jgi:hypothetical protein